MVAQAHLLGQGNKRAPSVTDLVFEDLYDRVIKLELLPGTKLSEVEIATQMDVSRQPVRDAFFRLSQLGFLLVRPQRATTVTPISERAVLQARFIRTAMELETVRTASTVLTPGQLDSLERILEQQKAVLNPEDREKFHTLDDEFHKAICEFSGHDYAWTLIRNTKAHMDRVRYLTLSYRAKTAYSEHVTLLQALKEHDIDGATATIRMHLSRVVEDMPNIRKDHPEIQWEEK